MLGLDDFDIYGSKKKWVKACIWYIAILTHLLEIVQYFIEVI